MLYGAVCIGEGIVDYGAGQLIESALSGIIIISYGTISTGIFVMFSFRIISDICGKASLLVALGFVKQFICIVVPFQMETVPDNQAVGRFAGTVLIGEQTKGGISDEI